MFRWLREYIENLFDPDRGEILDDDDDDPVVMGYIKPGRLLKEAPLEKDSEPKTRPDKKEKRYELRNEKIFSSGG